jgi:hypothetical protein
VNRRTMRVSCRIRVVGWLITSIGVVVARHANHQFPAARIPVGKRLAAREPIDVSVLRAGRRSAAQYRRGHSQNQSKPLHFSLPICCPNTHTLGWFPLRGNRKPFQTLIGFAISADGQCGAAPAMGRSTKPSMPTATARPRISLLEFPEFFRARPRRPRELLRARSILFVRYRLRFSNDKSPL